MKRLFAVLLLALLMGFSTTVSAQQYQSRLNQLVQKRPMLYLPLRLVLGEENQFTVKAPAGSKVMLYVSPVDGGFITPNGIALRVGDDHEQFYAEVAENGVSQIKVDMPAEEDWEGRELFVDALVWQAEDYSDMQEMQLVDASGRRTNTNALTMVKPSDSKGWGIMPSIPGVNTATLQQLENVSNAVGNGDERKKNLLDDGSINRDTLLDHNSLITRPGAVAPVLRP